MQILVAIPVYDGKLPAETVRSLLNEKGAAHLLGDDIVVEFVTACSHPAMGRNQLADSFVKSGFDRMIFLDSDVTFEPGQLLKLAHWPVDFVGGAYRFKLPIENYPIGWLPDPELKGLQANEFGLLEIAALPSGFMCLSQNVFAKIREAHPGREFTHMGKTFFTYFFMPYLDGHLWSEDAYFSKEWRETGGKVWLDPEIPLTHWDFSPTPYKGHIGNWLKTRKQE